jgi:hypothetical protein
MGIAVAATDAASDARALRRDPATSRQKEQSSAVVADTVDIAQFFAVAA